MMGIQMLNIINASSSHEEIREGLIQPSYGLKLDRKDSDDPAHSFVIQQLQLN